MNSDIKTIDEVAQHIDFKIQKQIESVPTITIITNKNIYHKRDPMKADVHIVNATDDGDLQVKIQIWLQLPDGKIWPPSIIKKWDILQAGKNKTYTIDISSLPLLPKGVYTWHARMKDKWGSKISQADAIWEFAGKGSSKINWMQIVPELDLDDNLLLASI